MADSVFTQMGSVVATAIAAKQTAIDAEETARINADNTLQTNIDAKANTADVGTFSDFTTALDAALA